MKEELQQDRRVPLGIVAGIFMLAMAVGGGIAFRISSQPSTSKSPVTPAPTTSPSPMESPAATLPVTPPSPQESPAVTLPVTPPSPQESPQPQQSPEVIPPVVQPTTETTVALYWVRDTGVDFELVPIPATVQATDDREEILVAAFDRLLTSTPDDNLFSTIPEGTQLMRLAIAEDGVYVDLSQEFSTGGGSASMTSRLGQVIYTATSLQPDANVWIFVNGEPLELLGGEGLEVAQPSTRQIFQQEFQF